ncbi:MAG: CvpA family protein [Spirosomaceae bacterium]|nr:CvpA family protein [Spirosomataceae bacterium]
MNTTDIVLLVPLLYGAYKGYKKGLFIEIIGVVAFIIALVIGFKFLGAGMNFLAPHVGEGVARRFVPYLSFGVIFFPTIFMINKLGWSMRRALRFTILGTLDGFAGGLLGAFTWVFGISTALWLLTTIGIKFPAEYTDESVLLPHVEQVAPTVISRVSDWIPAGGNLIEEWRNEYTN